MFRKHLRCQMQKVISIILRNSSLSIRIVDKLASGWRERNEIVRSNKKCSKKEGKLDY